MKLGFAGHAAFIIFTDLIQTFVIGIYKNGRFGKWNSRKQQILIMEAKKLVRRGRQVPVQT